MNYSTFTVHAGPLDLQSKRQYYPYTTVNMIEICFTIRFSCSEILSPNARFFTFGDLASASTDMYVIYHDGVMHVSFLHLLAGFIGIFRSP